MSLLLCACTASGDTSGRPLVVAAAYPFAFVVERVAGGHVAVQDLTQPGVEPHDIELTPQQVAAVQDADLVVVESGFQPAVDDAVAQADPQADRVLDVSAAVAVRDEDPHVWLDPRRMVVLTRAVADRLAALLPGRASAIQRNAARLVQSLQRLDRAYRSGLRHCKRRTVVTSHAAFGYLAHRYDLRMVSLAGLDPTQEPSPAQQARVVEIVERRDVTTLFTEPLAGSAVADSIADTTGARVATLDPVEGLSDQTQSQDYLSLMRRNLRVLRVANACS